MFGSYLNNNLNETQSQVPQRNQFLNGNPETDLSANTDWMNPSNATPNSGFSGTGSYGGATPINGQNNGTALGAISSGNVGQYIPEGYNSSKLNDPANANSLKYQVGRILSNYPPSPQGLQAAANELSRLGISVVGKDTISLPDGTTADVGRAFGDPSANHAWQYNWSGPSGGQSQNQSQNGQTAQPTSYMGSQPPISNQFLNQVANNMFTGQQAQRRLHSGDSNPNQSGGFIPPTGGFSGYGPNGTTSPLDNGNQYSSFMGGGVIDPFTGQRRTSGLSVG